MFEQGEILGRVPAAQKALFQQKRKQRLLKYKNQYQINLQRSAEGEGDQLGEESLGN